MRKEEYKIKMERDEEKDECVKNRIEKKNKRRIGYQDEARRAR